MGIVLAKFTIMRMIFCCVLAVLMLGVVAAAEPPAIVAERFQEAQESLESDQFVGSYTVTVSSLVAKEDGSANVATEMVMTVEVETGGDTRRHLESLIVNGEDRTEKNRDKLESGVDDDGGDDEEDEEFLMPFGSAAGRFEFGPAVASGDRIEMTFGPAQGHEEDKGISRGSMAWSSKTHDPLWLELDVLKPPKPMRELKVTMEFVRLGTIIVMDRMVTDGRVKVLLMKRKFHMDMTISDLVSE